MNGQQSQSTPRRGASRMLTALIAASISCGAAWVMIPELTAQVAQPHGSELEARQQAAIHAARGEVDRARALVDASIERIRAQWTINGELLAAEQELQTALNELERARQPVLQKLRENPEYVEAMKEEADAQRDLTREQILAEAAAASEVVLGGEVPESTPGTGVAPGSTPEAVASGGVPVQPTLPGATPPAAPSPPPAAQPGGTPPSGGAAVGGAVADIGDVPVTPLPPPTRGKIDAAMQKLEIRTRMREMEQAAFAEDSAVGIAQQRADSARAEVQRLRALLEVELQQDPEYRAAFQQLVDAQANLSSVLARTR